MPRQNDDKRMAKDRGLGLVEGNLRDAETNLWDTVPFEGRAFILRKINELRNALNLYTDADQVS